jgi:type VI secretion system protein ImpE
MTAQGAYYWAPFELLESIEFTVPKRPRDLLWRPAHLQLHGGQAVDGFVPALYPGSAQQEDDQVKLGRATDWKDSEDGPVRGAGLRVLLLGEQDRTILELNSVQFGRNA